MRSEYEIKSFVVCCLVTVLMASLFFYLPVLSLLIISAFSLLFLRGNNFYKVSISILAALFCTSINSSDWSAIGDVSRYYQGFELFGYAHALTDLKFFRLLMFFILESLDFPLKLYTFFSIFLILYLYLIYFDKYLSFYLKNNERPRYRLLKVTLIFVMFPFTISLSFENTLSMILFFCFLIEFCFYKKSSKAFIYLVFSLLVHASSIFFVFVFILSLIVKKSNLSLTLSSAIGCFFIISIVSLSQLELSSGIYFIDTVWYKFNNYLYGPWSSFIGFGERYMQFLGALKIVFILIMLRAYWNYYGEKDQYFLFCVIFFLFFTLFIFSRTLLFRYVYLGYLFFLPYVYIYLIKIKVSNFRKVLALSISLFFVLSSPNIFHILGSSERTYGKGELFTINLYDIVLEEFKTPSIDEVRESRLQKVEANKIE